MRSRLAACQCSPTFRSRIPPALIQDSRTPRRAALLGCVYTSIRPSPNRCLRIDCTKRNARVRLKFVFTSKTSSCQFHHPSLFSPASHSLLSTINHTTHPHHRNPGNAFPTAFRHPGRLASSGSAAVIWSATAAPSSLSLDPG